MVDKVTQPSWWIKDEEVNSPTGKMILGGIFGFLIGIIIVFSFSRLLLDNLGGWWGIYGIAAGFVILGAGFGWASAQESPQRAYRKPDINYWRT
ncbi:MAG: hypothetical protein KKE05_06095 [Nanoarchaeota archaeon]|nr:hypothetical protein [Nanoarchaeota archaeon]